MRKKQNGLGSAATVTQALTPVSAKQKEAIGIIAQSLANGEHRMACPGCGRGRDDKTLGLRVDDRGWVAHCFRCGEVSAQQHHSRRPYSTAQVAQKRGGISEYWLVFWNDCSPISGVAREYLQARACPMPPADGDLRWHPSAKHLTGYVGAALVGLITDITTAKPLGLHRTWVRSDGSKALVTPPRLLLKGHAIGNGTIRLWPDEAVTLGLGIAEGIETALALAHARLPVWSTIDAGHLKAFPLIGGIEALTIAADADPAGRDAAKACAARWSSAGREVRVVDVGRGDLNDFARREP